MAIYQIQGYGNAAFKTDYLTEEQGGIMEFKTDIFSQFDKKWALLTAGDKENFNTMTVA